MVSNTILITQARTGSTRLPGKVLKQINGKSLLKIHLDRLKKCKWVSEIIVATTTNNEDQIIFDKAIDWGLFLTIENLNYQQARFVEAHIKKMKSTDYIKNLKKYPEMVSKLVEKYKLV